MKTKERGITLIALVVTIIILLILAGVAINLSVGDNGLFHKAQEAVNTYKIAEQKESEDLRVLENELEKAKVDWSKVYDSTGYTPKTTSIEINEGTYYIPEGFKLADDSAGKISDGIVVEDKNGNQWVWVPCWLPNGRNVAVENRPNEDKELSEEEYANKKGLIKFDRYAFNREGMQYPQTKLEEKDEDGSYKIKCGGMDENYYFHEAMPTDQSESIKKYGGFYIGRYEASDSVSTEAKKMRTNADAEDNAVAIKKNQAPYNYIVAEKRKMLSTGMAEANGYNTEEVFTVLCSSYSWDTTLMFMGEDFAKNSSQGNYLDVTFSYIDIAGNTQTKNKNSNIIVPTGQTKAIKNIYDMGGNIWELTTGTFENASGSYVLRGGGRASSHLVCPASSRSGHGGWKMDDARIPFKPIH